MVGPPPGELEIRRHLHKMLPSSDGVRVFTSICRLLVVIAAAVASLQSSLLFLVAMVAVLGVVGGSGGNCGFSHRSQVSPQ